MKIGKIKSEKNHEYDAWFILYRCILFMQC